MTQMHTQPDGFYKISKLDNCISVADLYEYFKLSHGHTPVEEQGQTPRCGNNCTIMTMYVPSDDMCVECPTGKYATGVGAVDCTLSMAEKEKERERAKMRERERERSVVVSLRRSSVTTSQVMTTTPPPQAPSQKMQTVVIRVRISKAKFLEKEFQFLLATAVAGGVDVSEVQFISIEEVELRYFAGVVRQRLWPCS